MDGFEVKGSRLEDRRYVRCGRLEDDRSRDMACTPDFAKIPAPNKARLTFDIFPQTVVANEFSLPR